MSRKRSKPDHYRSQTYQIDRKSNPDKVTDNNYNYSNNYSNNSMIDDQRNVKNTLQMLGVERKYISRALNVYQKHYGQKYIIEIIIELIYRLKVKDKLKKQKHQQNIFESKHIVEDVLLSMDFSPYYIKKAIAEYKVT